jgi:hypothetical protein
MPEGVTATLLDAGQPVELTIIDISISGVALLIDALNETADGMLARWKRVGKLKLVLTGPRLGRPLVIDVQPIHGQELPQGILIGARLCPGVENQPFVEAAIERLFNRRAAVRAVPAFDQPVPVRVAGTSGRAPIVGRIQDLSLAGAGLLLAHVDADRLAVGEKRRVRFTLAAGEQPIDLPFAVTRIQVERRESMVAVAFDARVAQQPQIAQPLCRWITERQIEARELARARERAAAQKRLEPA